MKTAQVNGVDLRYELTGDGEPLLLIHGSNIATGLRPLANALSRHEPALRSVRYHRRGMGGSTGRGRRISTEQQAADALGLLDALELPDAHLLGYSYGATIAIEAALTAPQRVQSLILVEPILSEVPGSGRFFTSMEPILNFYAADDMAGAATATFAALGGPNWPELIATAGSDAFDDAVLDTEMCYRNEWPELATWRFDPVRATAMRAPVLSVLGSRSGPFFNEGRRLIHQRFPQCADADIPDANHLLYLQAPERIAAKIAGFLARSDRSRG